MNTEAARHWVSAVSDGDLVVGRALGAGADAALALLQRVTGELDVFRTSPGFNQLGDDGPELGKTLVPVKPWVLIAIGAQVFAKVVAFIPQTLDELAVVAIDLGQDALGR